MLHTVVHQSNECITLPSKPVSKPESLSGGIIATPPAKEAMYSLVDAIKMPKLNMSLSTHSIRHSFPPHPAISLHHMSDAMFCFVYYNQ